MDAGAGGFACGEEAGERSVTVNVAENTSHEVVRSGADGDEVAVELEAVFDEEARDAGEAGVQVFGDVAHVEVDGTVDALAGDGAGDDVSGSELDQWMVALHEALAVGVDEVCAFATEGFAKEKAGCSGLREGGGVELVELHIGDSGPGAVGHGDAVSSGDSRVGGVGVDLAGASAGKECGASVDVEDAAFAVEERGSDDAIVLGEEIDPGGPLHEADVGNAADVAEERDGDLAAGGVAVSVEDAGAGVRAFASEHELTVFAVEGCAPGEELFDALRTLLDEDAGGVGVDEAIAGGEGVFIVQGYVFVAADGDGDSTLGVGSVGFGELFLGDDENGAGAGEADGGTEASDAGADDEEVNVLLGGGEVRGIDGLCC
jgi:hypothetical protein